MALEHSDFIASYIQSELQARHYSGPFLPDRLEALIGPFRTAPLGVVPKPGSSKFYLVQDHSYPRGDPSLPLLNALIDMSVFNVDWGTFSDCWLLVAKAPPGSQAAIFDVEAAHRHSPIASEDQHLARVKFTSQGHDLIFIDHCACFGCSSSSPLFDCPGNTIIPIYRHRGVDDLIHWADDYAFIRYPITPSPTGPWSYRYDEKLVFDVAMELGWPWAPEKHIPFAFSFPYLGFTWDLSTRSVSIPGASFSLKECQSLVGCLQHCVLSEGRSRLPSFYSFASSFKDPSKPFVRHRLTSSVLSDITWWRAALSDDWCGYFITTPSDPLPHSIFVDTSTSFGIGFLFNSHWLAWQLLPGWQRDNCDIGWAEMVAIDLGLRTLIHSGLHDCHLVFHSDNQGVVGALHASRSRNSAQNEILHHIVSNFRDKHI